MEQKLIKSQKSSLLFLLSVGDFRLFLHIFFHQLPCSVNTLLEFGEMGRVSGYQH